MGGGGGITEFKTEQKRFFFWQITNYPNRRMSVHNQILQWASSSLIHVRKIGLMGLFRDHQGQFTQACHTCMGQTWSSVHWFWFCFKSPFTTMCVAVEHSHCLYGLQCQRTSCIVTLSFIFQGIGIVIHLVAGTLFIQTLCILEPLLSFPFIWLVIPMHMCVCVHACVHVCVCVCVH